MKEKRFSIRDLLALITCMAVLFAVGVPAFLKLRESSRYTQCGNNFKEVLLAMHNYHAAYKQLPAATGGTAGNANRLSGLIALVPFCEDQALWEEISSPSTTRRPFYPAMGPVPWNPTYPPWQAKFEPYLCPTDANLFRKTLGPFGRTNTVFCIGDSVRDIYKLKASASTSGMFAPRYALRLRDVLDGLSNTIAITEVANARGREVIGQFAVNMPASLLDSPDACLKTVGSTPRAEYKTDLILSDLGRGGNWADGAGGYSLMQTILPPNSPSCTVGGTAAVDGVLSAASRHPDGCFVGMGDGAVNFISNTIERGDPSVAPAGGPTRESRYGLWGALGTRAGMEVISDKRARLRR